MAATRNELLSQAAEAHVQYPQYAGYWDAWQVATITRDVRTKLGLAFRKGDRVLVDPAVSTPDFGPCAGVPFVTAYSFRNRCNTSIRLAWARIEAGAAR